MWLAPQRSWFMLRSLTWPARSLSPSTRSGCFMDRLPLQLQPSTKRRDFMDNRRHLKDPSIKKADFMDGDGFSGGPSTETRVFVDGRQNSWQRLLANRRKYVYLGVYERVLFGRLRADEIAGTPKHDIYEEGLLCSEFFRERERLRKNV